jgi:hypothetical protein
MREDVDVAEGILEKFLQSKCSSILVLGGNTREGHKVCSELMKKTCGNVCVYSYGSAEDFKFANPYVVDMRGGRKY